MRVLFVVFPEAGHLNPMICVAQHVVRAGHTVEVFSMEDVSPRLAAAGLAVRCHVAPGTPPDVGRATRGADLIALLRKPALARRWYRYVLLAQVPLQLAALQAVVAANRPDVIVTDPLAYAGVIAAVQAGVPWASVSTQLLALAPPDFRCPYLDYLDALAPGRDRLFAAEGVTVEIVNGEAVSPWLSTVFATAALGPSPHAIAVGPALPLGRRGDEPAFPWDRLRPAAPLVLASFGSQLTLPPEVIAALVAAVPSDVDLVLATRGAQPPGAPNVIAVEWMPQLALLARARAMVTHGGANSVAEALAHGVPQLVIPLAAEQPLQAHLLARAGVGIALELEAVSHATIAAAMTALLADGDLRDRAAELARSYATLDGARRTAELVIGLCART